MIFKKIQNLEAQLEETTLELNNLKNNITQQKILQNESNAPSKLSRINTTDTFPLQTQSELDPNNHMIDKNIVTDPISPRVLNNILTKLFNANIIKSIPNEIHQYSLLTLSDNVENTFLHDYILEISLFIENSNDLKYNNQSLLHSYRELQMKYDQQSVILIFLAINF